MRGGGGRPAPPASLTGLPRGRRRPSLSGAVLGARRQVATAACGAEPGPQPPPRPFPQTRRPPGPAAEAPGPLQGGRTPGCPAARDPRAVQVLWRGGWKGLFFPPNPPQCWQGPAAALGRALTSSQAR